MKSQIVALGWREIVDGTLVLVVLSPYLACACTRKMNVNLQYWLRVTCKTEL